MMIPMLVYEMVYIPNIVAMYGFAGIMTALGVGLYFQARGNWEGWRDVWTCFLFGLMWWVTIPLLFHAVGEGRAEDKAEIERLKKRRKR